MSDTTLEARFAAALRRELGMVGDAAPGATSVHVAAPAVHLAPRIVAELPALTEPLQVEDITAGAFGLRVRVTKRTESGGIDEFLIEPQTYHPLEQFR
jgi:hypothetical protein